MSDTPKNIWIWNDYDGDIDGHWVNQHNQSDKIPVGLVNKYHHDDVVKEKDRRIEELKKVLEDVLTKSGTMAILGHDCPKYIKDAWEVLNKQALEQKGGEHDS